MTNSNSIKEIGCQVGSIVGFQVGLEAQYGNETYGWSILAKIN